ncbi:helix-turn-helix transcriptional regulator [Sulfurimonas sp.]|uniref:helix-turn-helix transcriptional regulator n=1 Tax=Sulfurimonas sp. TaxID=2022749 RepID=UPI0035628C6F
MEHKNTSKLKKNKCQNIDKAMRIQEVIERVAISRSKIYDLSNKNLFPKPFKVKGTKMVRWRESEIQNWLEAQYDE